MLVFATLILALAHDCSALAANTTRTTGKGAIHDESVYCQNINGRESRGPYNGTKRQIPCGPNFRRQPAAQPSAQANPSPAPSPKPLTCSASSAQPQKTIANASQLAAAVFAQYNGKPIRIARLLNSDLPDCTFLVLLAGTEFKFGQSNNLFTDTLSTWGNLNEFFVDITDALYTAVPSRANVIIVGHSLGGMEAQNVAANPQVQSIYKVIEVITFGSPKTVEDVQGVRYVRFMIAMDPVPALAMKGYFSPPNYILLRDPPDVQKMTFSPTSFFLLGITAHNSYPRSPDLPQYDALGNRGGNRQLQLGDSDEFTAPGFLPLVTPPNGSN